MSEIEQIPAALTLTVSIDRGSKSWAVFNGFTLLTGFRGFNSEAEAIDDAMSWCALRNPNPPELVYPRITKMRTS